ncbi:UPF0246 protein [Bacteroidia bacterium]|nr:UPF0246 protein [Bacteroidia bacterium]
MLIVISPSKSIDFKEIGIYKGAGLPLFLKEADSLMAKLAGFRADEIAEKEKISIKMALAAYEFIQTFPSEQVVQKEAIFAFSGNVYDKLDAGGLDASALNFLQKHLCIFSAMYGVLRPLDRIKPYRLDMSSGLIPNLYAFWRDKVTTVVSQLLKENDYLLINLASVEYFKMMDLKLLPSQTRIITPVFQQEIKGKWTTNSLFAKHARGLMLRFIAENKITNPERLQSFDAEGYFYNPLPSDTNTWYFQKLPL